MNKNNSKDYIRPGNSAYCGIIHPESTGELKD